MKNRKFILSVLAGTLSAPVFILGCDYQKAEGSGTQSKEAKASQKDDGKSRVLETIDVTPGKTLTPQDQAKVSSLGLKILGHVSKAQQEIEAKKIDEAKGELTQANTLMKILKEVLPTVKVIDHIWVTKTDLSYLNTTEVHQDLVSIIASIDQIYDVLPEGEAKEHAKKAKTVLTKDKEKGAVKAKEELEAVEESLSFNEVDMSISYTSRMVKMAQADLEKNDPKDATAALQSVANGILFFDASIFDPMDVAMRRIWMGTQDYNGKDYKAAKSRMALAKKALTDVVQNGNKSMQESAKKLIAQITAIDVSKESPAATAALAVLWQDARKLVEEPQTKTK